jgi:AcrR family transcriptional regulator
MSGMSSAPARVYGGIDAAGRQAARRARLMEAGLDLLGTGGLAALTVRRVCQRAGLAARYFYESFPGLDALTVAVFDSIVEELIGSGLRALAAAPPGSRAQIRAALGCAIDLIGDDPRKGRVILTLALASPELAERRLDGAERIARMVAVHATAHFPQHPPAGDRRLVLLSRFVVGGFAEILTAWMRDPGGLSRGQLLDDCTELLLAASTALGQGTAA